MDNFNIMTKTIKCYYGYCSYSFEEDYVHIHGLYIFPKYRKQGKAKKLLQKAIDEIKNIGYQDNILIVAIPEENCISLENLKLFYMNMGLEVYEYYG